MYVVGIDENGLGPRLGPMVTTAVTVDVGPRYRAEKWRDRGLALGLTDSKQVASSKRMAFAESVALGTLSLTEAVTDLRASSYLGALHLDGDLGLRAPCPTPETSALCHAHDFALPAFGGSVDEGRALLAPLLRGATKLRVVRARSVVSCAYVLNESHGAGRNKLVLDLAAMERLALDARGGVGEPVLALCGMIGGIRDVPRFATHLPRESFEPVEESRSRRAYRVAELGELVFEVDADGAHLPVALASLVGKYVRELAMRRITGMLNAHDASLGAPSGYHDPVTGRFVDASAPLRRKLAIVDACFERNA